MARRYARASQPPDVLLSVVRHYLPSAARYYRLRDVDSGKLLPSQGRPAHECGLFQVTPPGLLPVGTWQILYYREAFGLDSAIPPADGTRPPTVVYGNDGVLLTPAEWERSEEAKQFQLERANRPIARKTAGICRR